MTKSGCKTREACREANFTMKNIEEITPALQACLANAEKLIEAAEASLKPGSYHIAYHLGALALEEIGKSSMVFMSALNPRPTEGAGCGPDHISRLRATTPWHRGGTHPVSRAGSVRNATTRKSSLDSGPSRFGKYRKPCTFRSLTRRKSARADAARIRGTGRRRQDWWVRIGQK